MRDYTPEYESFRDDAVAVLNGAAVTVAVIGFWAKPVYTGADRPRRRRDRLLPDAARARRHDPRRRLITLFALLGRWLGELPGRLAAPLAGLGRRAGSPGRWRSRGRRRAGTPGRRCARSCSGPRTSAAHRSCARHPARRDQLPANTRSRAAHLEVDALLLRHAVDEHLERAAALAGRGTREPFMQRPRGRMGEDQGYLDTVRPWWQAPIPSPRATRFRAARQFYRLDRLVDPLTLPYTVCVLLENLLRRAGTEHVTRGRRARAGGVAGAARRARKLAFMPARVIMQDLTGVPGRRRPGRDARRRRRARAATPAGVDPLVPVDLVIDHSVQVDAFGSDRRLRAQHRARVRAKRRALRAAALGAGRLPQLPRRAARAWASSTRSTSSTSAASCQVRDGVALPDTLVGTDSHTTMINALGVLGWGVGGIEAEAVMLGQPLYMHAAGRARRAHVGRAAAPASPPPTWC